VAGKRASSQNSRKHGLNSAPDFESSLEYQTLVELIAEEGFSAFACADIAAGLLNYRRVMNAYYETYTNPEPVNDFMHDMSVKGSIFIFREMLSESGSKPQDVRDMAALFASIQRQERRKGGVVSRRIADSHKLIRYQRNGIARLSRAIRQG
jgi:hypothetical protein